MNVELLNVGLLPRTGTIGIGFPLLCDLWRLHGGRGIVGSAQRKEKLDHSGAWALGGLSHWANAVWSA